MEWLSECPACGSTKNLRWGKKNLNKREKPRDLKDSEDQFLLDRLGRESLVRNIYVCLSCSFLFQNPSYDDQELRQIYRNSGPRTSEYYKSVGKSAGDLWDSPVAQRNVKARQAFYAQVIASCQAATILDYGGGSGLNLLHPLLKPMKKYVYDFGKDSASEKEITAIKSLNIDQTFDFILHTHVLEHEPNPKSSLIKLRRLIDPKGSLYLEVPFDYAERLITRRPGAIWHVNHFNRKTLVDIGRATGWFCEKVMIKNLPYSHSFLYCITAIMKVWPKPNRKSKI